MGQSWATATGGTWFCGHAARARLAELIADRRVVCEDRGRDFYGRMLATCRTAGRDLGRALVADGYAWAHARYAIDNVADAAAARRARRGVWQAETPPPWVWRRDVPPSAACTIKGNISAGGRRIYHTRASRHYTRTRIAPARGERWFCREAAARSARWRAPEA